MSHWVANSCLLAALLTATFSCAPDQSVHKPATESAVIEPPQPPPPPEPKEEIKRPAIEPPLPEGSGKTAWARNFEGLFIEGLDGGLYQPYRRTTIEVTQRALMDRGLYSGPINGILDLPTMKAIYAFQKAKRNLQICGIPTPRTRTLLAQGSHTDPVIPIDRPPKPKGA